MILSCIGLFMRPYTAFSDSPVFSGPDGRVKNSVLSGQVPGTEGESNFGTGYGYRYGINDTVEVEIDGVRHIFKPD